MAVAPFGVLDLSLVTDLLIARLRACRDASPLNTFTIEITGSMPGTVRSDSDCQLSLYLAHVAPDKHQRNIPPLGPGGRPVTAQPLALTLYYLLTAFSNANYVQEQQAMSIALRCFHQEPIVKTTVAIGGQNVPEEFTVTMEVESVDEVSRLWQAFSTPFRLSAMYKVGVVFLAPEAPTAQPAPRPERIGLTADPTALPPAGDGQVVGTLRTVVYDAPGSTAAQPDRRRHDLSPATAAPGDRVLLLGAGLNRPTSRRVYLLLSDGTEQEVTTWRAAPATLQGEGRIALDLPATVGAAPAATPPPGTYGLRVGADQAQGDPQDHRSNAVPVSIAPRVDVTGLPPILVGAAGLFTLAGAGFTAGRTEVLLDAVALTEAAGAPGAGEFQIGGGGTTLAFRPPTTLASGRYGVRLRVDGVEADPSWSIDLP